MLFNYLSLYHSLFRLPSFNLSQHQSLFQRVRSSHQVVKVLKLQLPASILPMNIQGWFPLGLIGWNSLQFKGLSRVFSSTSLKASVFWCSAFFMVQFSHPYMTTGKTVALAIWTFIGALAIRTFTGKVMPRYIKIFYGVKLIGKLIVWKNTMGDSGKPPVEKLHFNRKLPFQRHYRIFL